MIRKLMASSALLALVSAGAISVTYAAEPATVQTAASTATVTDSSQPIAPAHPTLASTIIGRSVYSSADPQSDNIGDVNDLIVSEDGSVTNAIIGVGGFLGIGEKNVAVPFDQLKVVESDGDFRLVYAATKEQLEAAPQFDRTAYDPSARAAATNASNDTTMPAPGTDLTAAPSAPVDTMAAAPADATTAPADTMAADTMAADSMAPAATTTADNSAPLSTDVGFTAAATDQVRASTLIGKEVYGSENASIGEISDLVLQKDGDSRVALIDVGGFLGIGEKTVAIPFADLKFSKADANAEPQVNVAMSKDQLEKLPAFDTSTVGTANMPAATDTMAAAPATTAPADPAADNPATTGSIAAMPDSQDLAASKLMGAEVYGTDDADIGEISDIVFNTKGDINAVVVDVGGFLGIGEKPVALNFDNLNVRTDESGTLMVSVNATKDQLDKAPAYQISLQ